MKWWKKATGSSKMVTWDDDKQELMEDLQAAYLDWNNAQYRMEWALGSDEVDCAIFELVAAEKKYDMLLRKAKELEWERTFIYYEREVI